MAKKSAKEIIEKAMPKVKVLAPIPESRLDDSASPATAGASIDKLREKYSGVLESLAPPIAEDSGEVASKKRRRIDDLLQLYLGPSANGASDEEPTPEVTDDVEIVRVQSRSETDDAESGPGARAIIVSKSKGKVIGKQG